MIYFCRLNVFTIRVKIKLSCKSTVIIASDLTEKEGYKYSF